MGKNVAQELQEKAKILKADGFLLLFKNVF